MQAIIKNGQWLADIAVEKTGSIEALFEMANANGLSITDNIRIGSKLELPEVVEPVVVQNFKVRGISPATSSESELIGIGYWAIAQTLIVG